MPTDDDFAAMIEAHRPMLARVAASIVGVDAAEDVVGDATVLAWQGRARFDGRSPGGWLATITRHRALDLVGRRRFVTVALDALPDRRDPAPGPEGEVLRREVGEAIAAALAAIPRDQAEAVLRCCGEGVAYHDLATEVGVDKGTVGTRVHRGRKRLQVLLAGAGERGEG